jgi:hypothetical protein
MINADGRKKASGHRSAEICVICDYFFSFATEGLAAERKSERAFYR